MRRRGIGDSVVVVLALSLVAPAARAGDATASAPPVACNALPNGSSLESLLGSAESCLEAGRAEPAAQLFALARRGFEARGDTSGVARSLRGLGDARGRQGDNRGALEAHAARLAIEEKRRNEAGVAAALYSMGRAEIRLSDYASAFAHLRRSLEIRERVGTDEERAVALNGLGVAHCQVGQFEQGLGYFLGSLGLAERRADRKAIAFSEGNVGLVYKNLGRYDEALAHLERSLGLEKALGNQEGVAETLTNIGNTYRGKGQAAAALGYFERSLVIKEKMGNPHAVAYALDAISEIKEDLGDLTAAVRYAERARDAYERAGDERGVAGALGNLGEAYMKLGRTAEARACFERSLAIADRIGAPSSAIQSLWDLAEVAARERRYAAAYEHLKRRSDLVEKVQGSESQRQVSELQAKYEADKRRRDIEALQQKAEIQALQLERERWVRYAMLGAALALLAASAILLRRYRHLLAFWKRKNMVGHYRILEVLGSGGMGVVYRAVDVLEPRHQVALKVLREDLSTDAVHRRRLLQEAALVDQLDHPGVVRVLERGEHQASVYIAMELLSGTTLADRIRSGRLPIPEVGAIMRQLVDAVAAIHGKGIVHRDLKPENVMLTDGGARAKLLDFGLAKSSTMSPLTETGCLMGTLHYAPPERIGGGEFTAAGDLYALGVVLYETLTGVKPFVGDLPVDVVRQILEKDPLPPSRLRAEIPGEMDGLVLSMLSRDPAKRPPASLVLESLERLGPDEPA